MRTGNPMLNDKTFENFGVYRRDLACEQSRAGVMTINGTAQKTMARSVSPPNGAPANRG